MDNEVIRLPDGCWAYKGALRRGGSHADGPRLDLGCGPDRPPGFIRVDIDFHVRPDIVVDLNRPPYPFGSQSVSYVRMRQCYEHLRARSIDVFTDIHRILVSDGVFELHYPNMFSLWNRFRFLTGNIVGSPEWHPHHLKLVPLRYTETLLRHVGFQVVRLGSPLMRVGLGDDVHLLMRKRR